MKAKTTQRSGLRLRRKFLTVAILAQKDLKPSVKGYSNSFGVQYRTPEGEEKVDNLTGKKEKVLKTKKPFPEQNRKKASHWFT